MAYAVPARLGTVILIRGALVAILLALGAAAGMAGHDAGHESGHDPNDKGGHAIGAAFGEDRDADRVDPFPPESLVAAGAEGAKNCPDLLDHRVEDLRGRTVDLCAFAGKVLLVVNTASYCGFTPQYEGLQAIYEAYRERGLVVMGFPANDFGRQEPGSDGEIAAFCEENFGLRFPMFSKVVVKGAEKIPLFAGLTSREGEGFWRGEIRWNFEKFLIGRDGEMERRFLTATKPRSPDVVAAVERALQAD